MFNFINHDPPPPYSPKTGNTSSNNKAPIDHKLPPNSFYINQQAQDVLKSLDELQENVLMQLTKYDTIVVLDDSGSMTHENRWEDARKSLAVFSQILTKYDDDGMDLYFLNRTQNNTKGIKCPEIVEQLCSEPPHSDFQTDIGAALSKIVDPYLTTLKSAAAAAAKAAEAPPTPVPATIPTKSGGLSARLKSILHRPDIPTIPAMPKPLNIIVITDGCPTDEPSVKHIIRKAALATADLDEFPEIQIGFQFVQVGSDPFAKIWLDQLDDDKGTLFARDVVDTRSYHEQALDVRLLLTVLIGAIEKNTDKTDASMWCAMKGERAAPPEKRT